MKYAYSKLNLDLETAQHCKFNTVSGEVTGTYRFFIGFYGLTAMPAGFQKIMVYTLVELDNTHCFLDVIIFIVSRGSKEDHLKLVYKCLQKIDEDNLRINLPKCHFAKTE